MKVYHALYCCNIWESSYATISVHRTKRGAKRAVEVHKAFLAKEFRETHGNEKTSFGHTYDSHKEWRVVEKELKD